MDFFGSKRHTIVPSSSLLPDSPNLLFTNAGMNQFVPIFLGQRKPDVDQWPGAKAGPDALPTRAANTQKCIRAGGKHNDLEDVGFDTYHHTFFEMLGNWSFGDYFKREAIQWAWELIVERWGFPVQRLYATVYKPDKPGEGEFDQESYDVWTELFQKAGLDPKIHIRFGGRRDNFWMMGETGPCGPCSEIHVDLTPEGNTQGRLVNAGSPQCIEVWNLVFIQFNADPDGTFDPLPARHVDTGMGLERVAAIMQCTRGFRDFTRPISNYDTDVFRPIFEALEDLSHKKYTGTLPDASRAVRPNSQEHIDIAFRVIADHLRTVSFAIADEILPGNTGRNYVVRRILRRAVRYGRTLGFNGPFFHKLVPVLAGTMGDIFPEIRSRSGFVQEVIRAEEEAFNRTLDRGLDLFNEQVEAVLQSGTEKVFPGAVAFKLYDTYGFPLDLTELMARERGLTVDRAEFDRLMEEQRVRARSAQKRIVVGVTNLEAAGTRFVGYDQLECEATIRDVIILENKPVAILDVTPCYPEMGGQIGDTGELVSGSRVWTITDTQRAGDTWLHFLGLQSDPESPDVDLPEAGARAIVRVNRARRQAIQRHHTATHLLHWALQQVLGPDVAQKGSFVGPEKLTFDFNSRALSPDELARVEAMINQCVVESATVSWTEVPYAAVRSRRDIRQFFGEKYGEVVRVVQIGGSPGALDGYSMELCGGTHCRSTGEIGLFQIVSESAVAAGVRRIEAVAGLAAYKWVRARLDLLQSVCARVNTPPGELERKIDSILAHQKALEKQLRTFQLKQAASVANTLVAKAEQLNGLNVIIEHLDDWTPDGVQAVANELRGRFKGVVLLLGTANGAASVVATVGPECLARVHAGKLVQAVAEVLGGKGGGKPDNARGGGKDVSAIPVAIQRARQFLAAC